MTALPSLTHATNTLNLGPYGLKGGGSDAKVYIGAEPRFSSEARQVADCFQHSKIVQEERLASASHYFLFITDSFLKSKEYLLPLIHRLHDPQFKQRLFPVIMDKTVSIFGAGDEAKYVQYWEEVSADNEVDTIRQNIAPLIRVLRDTLMPPLDQLLQDNLSLITDAIEKRSHLIDTGHFFFLPPVKAQVTRKAALAKLSSLFKGQNAISITGAKGIGKTTLAVEYAKQSTYPSGLFWLDATDEHTLEESYKQLAAQLGINPDQIKRKLSFKKDFLLIYDNVTDRSLVPSLFSGHTLFIGPNLPHPDMALGTFTSAEANLYITEQLGAPSSELCHVLENHPAKLTEAIAYIKSSKISAQAYIDFYQNDKERLLLKQQTKAASVIASSSALPSNLDPSPQTLEKYSQLSLEQLQKEFTEQNIQIFISYQWSAKQEVDQIDTLFKSLSIELLRDIRETRNFESLREFMKKVIRESDYTFSIINPNYLKSFNCLFEVITTMQDPYWRHRLFPLVLQGTDLSNTHLYTTHWQQEAERLEKAGASSKEVAIAQEGARKIAPFLEFVKQLQPDTLDVQLDTQFQRTLALMLARQEKIEKKGIYKQAIFHLPMGRNKDFTGREKELTLLETSLKNGHSGAITNTGMGGVGKSQLALEYAYRHEREYEMIYWIRSEQEATIKTDLRMLGLEMGISEDFLKDDNVISTMKNALQKRKGWLLVFDNAEDPNMVREILPQGGHILITSRNPNWEKAITVDVFSKEEALHYLQKVSGISGQEEEFNLLAEELGFLPLALTQAGAYIRRQQIDVATYRTVFKEGQKQMLSQKERGYPGSVATAWLLSMEKITKEDPNALKLLNICSCLAPDRIPEEFLEAWLKEKHHLAGLDFQDALRILDSYSLIDQKVEQKEGSHKKWISIHRLIQTVTLDQCEPEEAKQTIEVGIKVLDRQFKGEAGTSEEREAGETLILHAQALVGHAEEREILSKAAGNVAGNIGTFLRGTSDLKGAKEYLEKAVKIHVACLGTENHTDVAASYNNIGNVLKAQGDLKGAKEFYEKSLKIEIACLGTENHTNVANSYNNIGNVLQAQGDLKGAKELYEKAVKIHVACLGTENHTDVAASYNNIGLVLKAQGDLKGAKELYEKSLKIEIACLETENHTSVANSYNNIGVVLKDQGDLKEAKEYLEKALKIKIACLGTENHISVADSYNNIGVVLKDQGDLKRAKEFYEKALKIKIAYLGTENHTSVAASYNNIGGVLKDQGDLKEAKDALEIALKIKIVCLGTENHTSMAASYNNIGILLKDQGDLKGAKEYLEKAVKIYVACLGTENHTDVAASYNNIGNVLKAQGDLKGAKEFYEKALNIKIACLGTENHSSVAMSYMNLGDMSLALKQLQQAQAYYLKAKQIYQQVDGDKYDTFFDGKIRECQE